MRSYEQFHGGKAHSAAARELGGQPPAATFAPVPAPEPADVPEVFAGSGLAGLLGDVDWDVLTGGDAMSAILGWKR